MKPSIFNKLGKILVILMLLLVHQVVFAEESAVMTGTINDYFQLVTDEGDLFNIGDSEEALEMDFLPGSRIEASGVVKDIDGEKVIIISKFRVIEAPEQ